jgi:hypothetical protein
MNVIGVPSGSASVGAWDAASLGKAEPAGPPSPS